MILTQESCERSDVMFNFLRMKTYFESHGLKQKYIAEQSAIKESTLSLILNGKRKCLLEEYVRLCKLTNCDFDYFIDE